MFITALAYVALRLLGLGPDDAWSRPREAGSASTRRRARHSEVGQVLARRPRPLRLAGREPRPARDVYRAVRRVLHPSRLVLPYARHLPRHGRSSGGRIGGRSGSVRDGTASGVLRRVYDTIDFRRRIAARWSRVDTFMKPGTGCAAFDRAAQPPALSARRIAHRALRGLPRTHRFEQRERSAPGAFAGQRAPELPGPLRGRSGHPDLGPSLDGLEAWRWEDEAEGVRYAGARSNAWDTAFALRAMVAPGRRGGPALRRGLALLRETQISEELPSRLPRGESRSVAAGASPTAAPLAGERLHRGGARRVLAAEEAGSFARTADLRGAPTAGGGVHPGPAEPRRRLRHLRAAAGPAWLER